ncbi:MAG: DUF3365 domain-containing protein [Burkholderiales bacterium]|jgi:hypothetical protein
MNRLLMIPLTSLLLATPAAAEQPSEQDQRAMAREARQTSRDLVKQLGAALKQALAQSGPEGAVGVCRDTAPSLAGQLSRQTGWKVSRVSLKPRNPLIGLADPWEQEVLLRFNGAAASGRNTANLEFSEVVSEPEGQYFRYMMALPVKPLCLTCHGSDETIPRSVRARLQQEYPNDQATGYYAGQIRGAVTIKRKLDSGS